MEMGIIIKDGGEKRPQENLISCCETSHNHLITTHHSRKSGTVPPLYLIITARSSDNWVGNSGKKTSAMLLLLPVSIYSKRQVTQNINGKLNAQSNTI